MRKKEKGNRCERRTGAVRRGDETGEKYVNEYNMKYNAEEEYMCDKENKGNS